MDFMIKEREKYLCLSIMTLSGGPNSLLMKAQSIRSHNAIVEAGIGFVSSWKQWYHWARFLATYKRIA